MTVTTSRHPRLISAACLGLAVVATTAAVRAPHPPSLVVRAAGPVSQPSTPIVAPTPAATSVDKRTVEKPAAVPAMKNPVVERRKAPAPIRRNPDSLSVAEIREMIQAHHPGVLEGDPNVNTITLVVDAQGRYVVSLAELSEFKGWALGGGRVGGGGQGGPPTAADADRLKVAMAKARLRGMTLSGMTQGVRVDPISGDPVDVNPDSAAAMMDRLKALVAELNAREAKEKIGAADWTKPDSNQMTAIAKLKAAMAAENAKEDGMTVGEKIGLNTEALSRLIDPETIDSVRRRIFAPGELGATELRVFIVREKP